MTPVETALVVLVIILVILLLVLVVGMIVMLLTLRRVLGQVSKILGNIDGLTADFGATLKAAVTGLALLAGKMGSEQLNKVFKRSQRKTS